MIDPIFFKTTHQQQLARMNRALAMLGATNSLITRNPDRATLFQEICRVCVERGGMLLTWIGYPNHVSGFMEPLAHSGRVIGESYLRQLRIRLDPAHPQGQAPSAIAWRERRPYLCNDFQNDPCTVPWRKLADLHNVKALASFPVALDKNTVGVLALYADETDFFEPALEKVICEMCQDIAFGLLNLEREARRQQAEWALLQLTQELERKVTERTAELRAANQRLQEQTEYLQRFNREISTLAELSDFLQNCDDEAMANPIIAQRGAILFPHGSGQLFLADASGDALYCAAQWGVAEDSFVAQFQRRQCWALCHDEPCRALTNRRQECGIHCLTPCLCLPLLSAERAFGVLRIPLAMDAAPEQQAAQENLAWRLLHCLTLGLANLRLRRELRYFSLHDPLTGLYNRRFMEESLRLQLRRVARRSGHSLALLIVDIDHFKRINDQYGHQIGDQALCWLARQFRAFVRESDVVCRYGGEEFILLFPDAPLATALERGERLRAAIAMSSAQGGDNGIPPLTVSIGIAISPDRGETPDALFKAADAALYRAKANGRNRVEVAGDC
jgi:diguanylate cyclase (GGDEF)-like protein